MPSAATAGHTWSGTARTRRSPKCPASSPPLLYTRLGDAGDTFEPQRNVIKTHAGLDGGGSVAADEKGNVYLAWHAPERLDANDEGNRRVWVIHSADDGKTFGEEVAAFSEALGACGCCMRIFAEGPGTLSALYRSTNEKTNRDMYLLRSADAGKTFKLDKVGPAKSAVCQMSTSTLARFGDTLVAAYETNNKVDIRLVTKEALSNPIAPPGAGKIQKHPAVAVDKPGNILLAWTEGTGWQKGGALAWQVFDKTGKPIDGQAGRLADGIRVWSLPTAFARPDGGFVIVH